MGIIDISGMKFGRLTPVECIGIDKHGNAKWRCACDCGGEKTAIAGSLKAGLTKSCGCISKERPSHTKHNGSGTKLYGVWKAMRERCNTTTSSSYRHYGARGISVCSEWDDFSVFRKWAKENAYKNTLTIDRIDNNGNYSPDNCRWVTQRQQSWNTTRTKYHEIDGIVKPFPEWVAIFNVPYKRAHQHLMRGGNPFKTRTAEANSIFDL